jgi:hypothetical protein
MSILNPVSRTEVQLSLEIKGKEALDYYNTQNSTSIPMQYQNVKFKTPIDGGAYVRFMVNYGTSALKVSAIDESRQAGIVIIKTHTPLLKGRFDAMELSSTFEDFFDSIQYADYSLRVNQVASGIEAGVEGEYWTEKTFVYFDYIKKGINPNG